VKTHIATVLLTLLGQACATAAPPPASPTLNQETTMTASASDRSKSGYVITRLSSDEVERLAASLTDEERFVILHQGTERPFCGLLLNNKEKGVYTCRLCGLPLFASSTKFESGTGWPSFFASFDPDHIRNIEDRSHGMLRTEIRCQRCDAHLGHVFPDGPPPTGQRYCLNSVSIEFHAEGKPLPVKVAVDRPQ
jgi:peptide-methionine (R)-S-oxide reductase